MEFVNPQPSGIAGQGMIEALMPIWQRVLRKSFVGANDNFFLDLGGNFRLADELFREIASVIGRELPSTTICQAPTIATLAALMEQSVLPPFSPFVRIKAGEQKPPIFMTHGLEGTVQFFGLAKHILTGHPIYGIQAKGLDGIEKALDRVEDMAEFYLDSLMELQPHGPYILIGYSFGGLIALEMAQRLVQSGKHVELLALVDAYPHPRYLAPGLRFRLMAQKVKGHVSGMRKMAPGDAFSYFVRALKRRSALVPNRVDIPARIPRLSFVRAIPRVQEKAYVALRHYRPRFYPGKMKFVKAEVETFLPSDPTAVWRKLATELEVDTVPGDHLQIITTHFEKLAATLTRYLREALDEK